MHAEEFAWKRKQCLTHGPVKAMPCYFCGGIYECSRTKPLTSKTSGCVETFPDKWLGLSKGRESIAGWMSHCKASKCPKQQSTALWKELVGRCLSASSHPSEALTFEDTHEDSHIRWFFIFETSTFVFPTLPRSRCFLLSLLLFCFPGGLVTPRVLKPLPTALASSSSASMYSWFLLPAKGDWRGESGSAYPSQRATRWDHWSVSDAGGCPRLNVLCEPEATAGGNSIVTVSFPDASPDGPVN